MMRSRIPRILGSVCVATVLSCIVACETTQETSTTMPAEVSMGMVNANCPIMGGAVDEGAAAEYKGNKVGFCCPGCINKWNEMSESDKDAFIAKNMK